MLPNLCATFTHEAQGCDCLSALTNDEIQNGEYMLDLASGEDGSGIVHEQELDSCDSEVSCEIEVGNTVELFVGGENIFARITDIDNPGIEGVVTKIPFASTNTGLEEHEIAQFGLANISRCIH